MVLVVETATWLRSGASGLEREWAQSSEPILVRGTSAGAHGLVACWPLAHGRPRNFPVIEKSRQFQACISLRVYCTRMLVPAHGSARGEPPMRWYAWVSPTP